MRRTDALLVLVVGALAVFVAKQVAARPKPVKAPSVSIKPAVPRQLVQSGVPRDPVPASVPPQTPDAKRDVPEGRRDVPGTYLTAMVADLNGQLVRWPDRLEQGLRIWVQSLSAVHDWDLRYAQMARDAFDDWGSVGLPLRFDFILDSASSDIQIVWAEGFPPEDGRRVGLTQRATDKNGWIKSAHIAVAIHDSTGRAIPPKNLVGVVRHEAGHALGLGHSNDPTSMMYPTEMVTELSPADRATLKLLYQFPPGTVR